MKNCLFFVLLVFFCCSCAKPPAVDVEPEKRNGTAGRLQSYLASAEAPFEPFLLRMSLRFGTEEDTRRVSALFWGNSADHLRLDVTAGIGVTAAKIVEDGPLFLLYSPNENKAWFYQGAAKPLLRAGMPIPFDLSHLANLLNGRYALVFGKECGQGEFLRDDLLRCEPGGKLGGELSIGADGLPRLWREKPQGGGWEMRIDYGEGERVLPYRLTLTAENGKRAIVLVKERERPATPFTDEQLRFVLPEDTPFLPLTNYSQNGRKN